MTSRDALEAGIDLMKENLSSAGFSIELGDVGNSSGGPFASACFRRGDLEIRVIVRGGSRMGLPNYSVGKGYAGHTDLVRRLGKGGTEQLISASFQECVGRQGQEPFQAFKEDIDRIILPALRRSEERFFAALLEAYEDFQSSLEPG